MQAHFKRSIVLVGLLTLAAVVTATYVAGCGGTGSVAGAGDFGQGATEGFQASPTDPAPSALAAAMAAALDTTAAVPRLALALAPQLDTSAGTVKVTSITQAELLNTAKTVVKTANVSNGVAKFPLTGLTAGHYFIRVNGLASDPVPTKIDNPAVGMKQYVGQKLRDSVIGSLASPSYRFQTFSRGQGFPHVLKYSNGTAATPLGYPYEILRPSTETVEVRYLATAKLLTSRKHNGPHTFSTWIMGPNSHGKSSLNCSGCHGNTNSHPASYASIKQDNGWCFKCHYGPIGCSNGMVKPTQ